MSYAKTISFNPDEVAVVIMALAERRVACERLAAFGLSRTHWRAAILEVDALQARLAALPYADEPQITDDELAALEEEEALEEQRLRDEENEWEAQEEYRLGACYDEYEYEDRLNPFVD